MVNHTMVAVEVMVTFEVVMPVAVTIFCYIVSIEAAVTGRGYGHSTLVLE